MLKYLIGSGLRAGLKNWTAVLFFEITYKIAGYILFSNLWELLKIAMLKVLEVPVIGQQNIGLIFRNPICIILILLAFLLVAFYVYLEITALILYCEDGWQGRPLSPWALWKRAFLRALALFHPQNLPVALALVPAIGLSTLPLTTGFTGKLQIPEFIFDYIKGVPGLFAAFLVVMTLLNVLLFFYLFSFPAVILGENRYRGALRESARLLKGRKFKTALALLAGVLAFLLLALLLLIFMILLLFCQSKLAFEPDGGREMFVFHYLKWSAMGRVLLGILGPVSLFSVVVALYHHYRGDIRPAPASVRYSWKAILSGALSVAASLLILGVFSETELGGNPYSHPQTGMVVVSHRAGAAFAPENTLAALEWSIQEGADMAEIDVQQTRDGALIVLHDTDFRRVAGFSQKVWEADYATVRTLDAGSHFSAEFAGERIPTLDEMLSAAKGRIRLMIELKATGHETGLVAQAVAAIKAAGMERQCLIASMDTSLLRESKALAPQIDTVYITMMAFSDRYDLPYVDAYSVETGFLTPELITQLHVKGKKVYVWTANSEANMLKIIRMGADGLVTDNPPLADFFLKVTDKNYFLESLTELLYPCAQ
ncbi:MAG: glycerophosphodiester phosphodiesterase family protein [Oscillospiraceae bacterium]|nr:glycerophosphodiester phosphodiesterase family protein [Oscillospiraceae bacterium]